MYDCIWKLLTASIQKAYKYEATTKIEDNFVSLLQIFEKKTEESSHRGVDAVSFATSSGKWTILGEKKQINTSKTTLKNKYNKTKHL